MEEGFAAATGGIGDGPEDGRLLSLEELEEVGEGDELDEREEDELVSRLWRALLLLRSARRTLSFTLARLSSCLRTLSPSPLTLLSRLFKALKTAASTGAADGGVCWTLI
jgi:hypothetical protein